MRQTKKLTLSAMIVALGTLIMTVGSLIGVLDLSACALAAVLMAFVYIEIGSPYTWLVWLATTLATFLINQGRAEVAIEYLLIFGIYPIIKAYIERLPKKLWIPIKFLYANAAIWLLILAIEFVLGAPFFTDGRLWLNALLYVAMNAAFFAFDIFITLLVRFYLEKLRNRFKHLLK